MLSELDEPEPVDLPFDAAEHTTSYIIRDLSDLFAHMGGRSSLADAQVLWRMLREEGCLRLEEHHTVIELSESAFRARCMRAKIASRRERSMIGRFEGLA